MTFESGGMIVIRERAQQFGLQVSRSPVDVFGKLPDYGAKRLIEICFCDCLDIVWHSGSFYFPTFRPRTHRSRTIRIQ